jgi:hypothetical protein
MIGLWGDCMSAITTVVLPSDEVAAGLMIDILG